MMAKSTYALTISLNCEPWNLVIHMTRAIEIVFYLFRIRDTPFCN